MKTTGMNIKLYRLKSNLNQSDLAKALFVSTGTVSNWESGRFSPGISKLKKIASVLGVEVSDLLGDAPIIEKERKILSCAAVIRAARKYRGLTQEDVAKKLNVSQSTIAAWENEQAMPPLEKVKEMCLLYDISACEVLGLVCFQENADLFHLIKNYDSLSEEGQSRVVQYMADIIQTYQK